MGLQVLETEYIELVAPPIFEQNEHAYEVGIHQRDSPLYYLFVIDNLYAEECVGLERP